MFPSHIVQTLSHLNNIRVLLVLVHLLNMMCHSVFRLNIALLDILEKYDLMATWLTTTHPLACALLMGSTTHKEELLSESS